MSLFNICCYSKMLLLSCCSRKNFFRMAECDLFFDLEKTQRFFIFWGLGLFFPNQSKVLCNSLENSLCSIYHPIYFISLGRPLCNTIFSSILWPVNQWILWLWICASLLIAFLYSFPRNVSRRKLQQLDNIKRCT